MLSESDKDEILSRFPPIKLSFETYVHKTVSKFDFEIVIPIGSKYFAQFTMFRGRRVCILLEIFQNNKIRNILLKPINYTSELDESIFYGTLIRKGKTESFAFEDIYYYKRENIANMHFIHKLALFQKVFESGLPNNIFFGLPIINSKERPGYVVRHIQYRFATTPLIMVSKKETAGVVFKISPALEPDMYNLFALDDAKKEIFYDVANVPDFKTSVLLNSLFRNIKENANLDALEESDDEDEFENTSPEKFVDLNKTYNMLCVFNQKYRRWTPVSISTDEIVSKNSLSRYTV